MPPFLLGAPLPIGASHPDSLWDFDFTTLSLGGHSAASFLSATAVGNPAGLTFSRASISTVQTDLNTLDSTPGVDVAVVGNETNDPTKKGLVLQQRTFNEVFTPRNIVNMTGDFARLGDATQTVNQANGPDGASLTADEVTASSAVTGGVAGQFSDAWYEPTTHDVAFSIWFKDLGSNGNQMTANDNFGGTTGGNTGVAAAFPHDTNWRRFVLFRSSVVGTLGHNFTPVDARDFSGVGGRTVTAVHGYVDVIQCEFGSFATEAILTNSAREGDRLVYNGPGTDLIASNGQIRVYTKWVAKADSAHGQWCFTSGNYSPSNANGMIVCWGVGGVSFLQNYILINTANKVQVNFNNSGVPSTSTNAMTYVRGDVVELFVAAGNNVASVCKYRINGGSWVDLVLGTRTEVLSPGTIYVMHNPNDPNPQQTYQPYCWLQHLTFYKSTSAPAGI